MQLEATRAAINSNMKHRFFRTITSLLTGLSGLGIAADWVHFNTDIASKGPDHANLSA
jgi:hypothetical protein